jgi:coenzyme Q-binding protein COQ10
LSQKKIKKKFNYSKEKIIKLVLDIDNYKKFLPWCKDSKILSNNDNLDNKIIIADLEIGYKIFSDTYRSEVIYKKNEGLIEVNPVSGPLRKLVNIWKITSLNENSCEIDFYIDLELNNTVLDSMMSKMFDIGFNKILNAFSDRADYLYKSDI